MNEYKEIIAALDQERFEIIASIVELWKRMERMPLAEQVKLDLDRNNKRYRLDSIESGFKVLERHGFCTPMGQFTGRRQSTDKGREFFRHFLDKFARTRRVS